MPNGTHVPLPNDARLTLQTLGGWALAFDHAAPAAAPVFGPSKPLALIVYLALSPNRCAGREHLMDLLWADLDPDAAAHALRQTIWFVRQRLGPDALHSSSGVVSLGLAMTVDRDAFIAAVECQDRETAIGLYRGDFLPAFAAPGGAEFERWADMERFRLRSLFVRTAESQARGFLGTGHFKEALSLARRVRDTDLESEAGARLLLEALIAGRDMLSAATEADQLERRLSNEDREPEPATRALLRLARQLPDEATPNAPATLIAELVGRETEFGAVVAAWEAVRNGASRHIHLTSPAGLGKSRLLSDVHTRLRAGGARTLLLRATPGERTLTHAFASDLATALASLPGATALDPASAGTLVALAPPLAERYRHLEQDRSTGSEAARRRLLALTQLVHATCEESPLALLLDDVQWTDPESRELLGGLIGRLVKEPVLIVTTARPISEAILDRGDTQHFALEPLTPPQVGAFLSSLAQLPDEPWARDVACRMHRAVRGSPLALLETLQLALERDAMAINHQTWQCRDDKALDRLLAEGAALRHRLDQLDREKRWLLLLLAIHGRALPVTALHDAAPRPADSIVRDLAALEQRGLVARQHDRWQVAHDAIGELAEEMAGEETVRAAHTALGRSAALSGGDSEQRRRSAQHAAAAGDRSTLLYRAAQDLGAARRAGDRRPAGDILADTLGAPGTTTMRDVLAGLPWRLRLGLGLRHAAAAAFLVVGAVLTAAWSLSRPAPDATLVMFTRDSAGITRMHVINVDVDRWRPDAQARLGRGTVIDWPFPSGNGEWPAGYLPALGAWHAAPSFADPGGQDPVLVQRWGQWTRLDSARGDDFITSESPDGRYLLVQTAQWNPLSRYDVGLYNVATRRTTPLTQGNGSDLDARWSPHGVRIAFIRKVMSSRVQPGHFRLCTTDLLRQERCLPTQQQALSLLAWRDTSTVIVQQGENPRVLLTMDVNTGEAKAIRPASWASASPDGRWIIIRDGPRIDGSTGWTIFPTGRQDLATRIIVPAGLRALPTWKSRPPDRYVTRLEGLAPFETVMVGIPYQPRMQAVLADSGRESTERLVWQSSDTATLGIDASGTLVARRTGPVTLSASVGGWRTVQSAVVVISPPAATVALAERWSDGTASRWRSFGAPRPLVVTTPDGSRAFFNNGDGSFVSGAWTHQGLVADQGLGVEQLIQAPVDSGQWQRATLELTSDLDTAAARTWSDAVDMPPGLSTRSDNCQASLPYGEGSQVPADVNFGVGGNEVRLPDNQLLGRSWHRIRLQIFPDGRCGLAIDGRARAITHASLRTGRRYFAMVYGNSMWTRILVRSVDVWTGVRTDVDWTRIERGP